MSQYGICINYQEVLRFKKNTAAVSETTNLDFPAQDFEFVADNVDYNPTNVDMG